MRAITQAAACLLAALATAGTAGAAAVADSVYIEMEYHAQP